MVRPKDPRIKYMYKKFREMEADLVDTIIKLREELIKETQDKAIPCLKRVDLVNQMNLIVEKASLVNDHFEMWQSVKDLANDSMDIDLDQ